MLSVFGLLLVFIAALGSGTMVAILFTLFTRIKQLEQGVAGNPGTLADLEDEIRQLREEVDGVRGDLSELYERVDFTERLLTRGSPSGSPTPDHQDTSDAPPRPIP